MMEEKKEPKLAYRLIPCPQYDVSGMECWLSEMAEQGLILQQDGFLFGFATFEKTTPQKIRYSLQAAAKSTSMWSDNMGVPDSEEIELSQEFGWEYVASRGEFHVYRTCNFEAIDLHTDKEVQALAMNAMKKRQKDNIFSMLFFAIIYLYMIMGGKILMSMVHIGTIPMTFVLISVIWMAANSVIRAVKLMKLRKKILLGGTIGSGKEWKKGKLGYHVNNIVRKCVYVISILLLVKTWGNLAIYENYIPLTEYKGDVPFKTMAEFIPGGKIELLNFQMGNINTVREWSDVLSPVNYEWDENGSVSTEEGFVYSGGLEVVYHETKAEWIADRLFTEYLRKGKQEKEFEILNLELEGLDEVTAYVTKVRFPCVVMRKDNKILYARFYTNSGKSLQFELSEWTGILAESLY